MATDQDTKSYLSTELENLSRPKSAKKVSSRKAGAVKNGSAASSHAFSKVKRRNSDSAMVVNDKLLTSLQGRRFDRFGPPPLSSPTIIPSHRQTVLTALPPSLPHYWTVTPCSLPYPLLSHTIAAGRMGASSTWFSVQCKAAAPQRASYRAISRIGSGAASRS
jgi:hypothetical protein